MTQNGSAVASPLALSLAALLAGPQLAGALSAQEVTWWNKSLDEALVAAKDAPAGLVLVYFFEDDNGHCEAMFSGTMADARVQKAMTEFVCVGAKNDDTGKATWEKFGVRSAPACYLLQPDGSIADMVPGYVTIDAFLAELQRIKAGDGTIGSLRKKIDDGSATMADRQLLMQRLRLIGDQEGAQKVRDAMIAEDPKGKSPEAAEALLWQICDATFAPEIEPQNYDMTELRRFLKSQRNDRVRFLGYERMAAGEYRRDDLKEAAEAVDKAWKYVPDDQMVPWTGRILGIVYERRTEIEDISKGLLKDALKMSKERLKVIETQQKKDGDVAYLADAMYLHAAILLINRKRSEALELMEQAIQTSPKSEYLKAKLKSWVSGDK